MARAEYIIRRLLLGVLVLVGVSLVTFVVARLIPSDPASLWLGPRAMPDQVEKARVEMGFDRPLHEQYLRYVGQVLRGDFGISVMTHRPIVDELRVFVPATLELVIFSVVITVVIGIPLGVVAAGRKDTALDYVIRVFAVTNVSVPAFWVAMLLQLVFARYLGLLPLSGRVSRDISVFAPIEQITGFYLVDAALAGSWLQFREALVHLVLPSLAVASFGIGLSIRMTRAIMLEVLEEKYITGAWAAGLRRRTIYFRLALKNAIVPTLRTLGLCFVWQISGAVLVEIVFLWPGIGTYLLTAIRVVDFPVVVSVALVVAVFYVLTNLALDIVQGVIDPRVRLE